MTDCEIAEFWSHSEPIARKRHRCCECSAPILKGEKHFYGSGKWDGEFNSYRQHLACMEACMLIRDKLNGFECIAFGGLHEYVWEFREDIRQAARKGNEDAKRLRSLLAKIKWRERAA